MRYTISDLQTYQIYKNLGWLNELPNAEAESLFRDCSGSTEWSRQMAAVRPFPMVEDLFESAERLWYALAPADRLETFTAERLKIGLSGIDPQENGTFAQFEEVNRLYENKFGFIFIVNASGKLTDEILAICKARLGNTLETELQIASEEYLKILDARLDKLLEK